MKAPSNFLESTSCIATLTRRPGVDDQATTAFVAGQEMHIGSKHSTSTLLSFITVVPEGNGLFALFLLLGFSDGGDVRLKVVKEYDVEKPEVFEVSYKDRER